MSDMMQQRRDTAANWATANPVMGAGQIGFEIDSKPWRQKVGDGVTAWNDLPYTVFNTASVKKLVAIGDSEVAGYPYYPSETVYPTMEQDIANTSSWTNVIRQRTGMTVYNRGIGGQTTAEILARFNNDVLAVNPTYCIIEGMINDIVKTSKLVNAAGTQANFEAMIGKCQEAGVIPIIAISAPLQPISGLVTAANITDYKARIATLKAYCAAHKIEVIDFYNLFIQNITGNVISSLIYTDNLHPNTDGYLRMGAYAVYRLKQIIPEFKIAQSPFEDFIRHDASGTSPDIGYKTGDLDIEKAPAIGSPLFWTCLDQATNKWGGAGHVRNTNAQAPNRSFFLPTNDTVDRYWEVGDLVWYLASASQLTLYEVTKAGWSAVHPVEAEKATFTPRASIPLGAAQQMVFFDNAASPNLTTMYPAGAIVCYPDAGYAYMTFTAGYNANSSLSPKGTWYKITNT